MLELDEDIKFNKYHYYWIRLKKTGDLIIWEGIFEHHHDDEVLENGIEKADNSEQFATLPLKDGESLCVDFCSKNRRRLVDICTGFNAACNFVRIYDNLITKWEAKYAKNNRVDEV